MKKFISTLLFFAMLGLALPAAAANPNAAQYKHKIDTTLRGNEEVPPVSTTMTGEATFHVANDEQSIHYALRVQSSQAVTGAHIHCGKRGENGPVVVPLMITASGMITSQNITAEAMNCNPNIQTMAHLIQAMRSGTVYVNVHTVSNPSGEIRGQIMMDQTTWLMDMGDRVFTTSGIGIQELQSGSSTARTFLITINTELLQRLNQLWQRAQDLFPQLHQWITRNIQNIR